MRRNSLNATPYTSAGVYARCPYYLVLQTQIRIVFDVCNMQRSICKVCLLGRQACCGGDLSPSKARPSAWRCVAAVRRRSNAQTITTLQAESSHIQCYVSGFYNTMAYAGIVSIHRDFPHSRARRRALFACNFLLSVVCSSCTQNTLAYKSELPCTGGSTGGSTGGREGVQEGGREYTREGGSTGGRGQNCRQQYAVPNYVFLI